MPSRIFRNLSVSFAGGATLSRPPAPVFVSDISAAFIRRQRLPRELRANDSNLVVDVVCLVRSLARSLAVRADHHPHLLSTAGAVITAISCAYRATHTNGHLLSDQQNQAANPAAIQPIIFIKSPSMIDINNADRLMNPHTPAKTVSSTEPAKPMAFKKVLDTIDSI